MHSLKFLLTHGAYAAVFLGFSALTFPAFSAETSQKPTQTTENPESRPSAPANAVATAGSLLATLSDSEQDYYEQSFSYTMAAIKENQLYDWRTHSSEGQIRPGKRFKSKSGATCRSFSETYLIRGQQGQNSGFGCKRGNGDGWCKLSKSSMLSCDLEPPRGVLEQVVQGTITTERKGEDLQRKTTEGFWRWWPF